MKTILITGGAGFVGSYLAEELLKEGHSVISIDNFITSDDTKIKKLSKYKTFSFFEHDVIQPLDVIWDKVESIDHIYHLACPTGVPHLIPLAEEMLLTCSTGTKNVLDLARDARASLVFTSSSEVYGDPHISPQNEIYTGNVNTTGERSAYEEGKRFSESLLTMYVRKYNLNAKIVRVFNTYGPGMSPKDTRVIPQFIAASLLNDPIEVIGDGKQTRTFCYVDDLVKGLILVQEKGRRGEVYNLGSTEQISIVDLALLIKKTARSQSKIVFVPEFIEDHKSRLPDITKVQNLGWIPTVSIQKGISETIALLQKSHYEIRVSI